jgi:hypothetical protein
MAIGSERPKLPDCRRLGEFAECARGSSPIAQSSNCGGDRDSAGAMRASRWFALLWHVCPLLARTQALAALTPKEQVFAASEEPRNRQHSTLPTSRGTQGTEASERKRHNGRLLRDQEHSRTLQTSVSCIERSAEPQRSSHSAYLDSDECHSWFAWSRTPDMEDTQPTG